MKYSWANLSIQFYVYFVFFVYESRSTLVHMLEALVNFHSAGISFVWASDYIIHSKWFVLCGIFAFKWENENGHELYWKLHKCTLCISTYAHCHIYAVAVKIDIWPHRTIKNYHTSSILFRNCITFRFEKHIETTTTGTVRVSVCSDKRVEKKRKNEKNKCSNDITAIIIGYNLFGVLFSSSDVRFAPFLPV